MLPLRRLAGVLALVVAFLAWLAPAAQAQHGVQPLCSGCGGGTTDSVLVTPDGTATPSRPTNGTGYSVKFAVTNIGHTTPAVTLACVSTGGVVCGTVSPSSLPAMDHGEVDSVTINYSTNNTAGSSALILWGYPPTGGDSGSYSISVVPQPPTISLVVPTGTTRAVVHNRQPILRATFLPASGGTVDTTATVVTWGGDTVTALGRHSRGLFEWEVDSTRWLTSGGARDSAQFTVRACDTDGGCTSASRWVVLPADSTPVLGFTGMPLENLGGGFASSFGPGFSVSGAEVETGFSVPGYVSMGVTRSAGLVYSTRQSYPRAIVNVDLDLPWPASTPSQIKLILSDSIAHRDSLTLTGTAAACATGAVHRCRASLQADFAGETYTTPTRKWLRIEAQITSGTVMKSSVDSVEVVVVDRRTAVYGSGWWPAGITQLVKAGNDRLVVGATGTATVYRGNGDSVYIASPGNFTALVKTASGWELRPRGSLAKVVFNASGQLVRSVDQNGNRDSVVYNANGRVDSLLDPMGKRLRFGYDANGRIASLTDPGGRLSAIRVNNTTGQLVYDSLSAPGARHDTTAYRYRTYPGTGTVVLYARYGVLLGDSTHVVYDSTFKRRPASVVLARVQDETGATVSPTVTYGAYERRGYGALTSLDSVYVEMKDPLNHWTRSLLNRWGQSRKTWDALGTIAVATYSAEGLVLTTEGKNGDSSRVYHDYDAARRLVRSYICRGSCTGTSVLRTDSLVYDASHRVIRAIDARGQATELTYDANGNVTRTINPANDTSFVAYLANGQVDSTTAPGLHLGTHYTYDAVWKNAERVIDAGGDTLGVTTYDSLGRAIRADRKLRIQLTATTDTLQWRRTESFYNAANQADSVRTMLSARCKGTGCDVVIWPSVSDTTMTQRVGHRYDAAGRDTARVNDRGKASIVHLDLLGRVRARYPFADSLSTIRDSSYYDIAGNLRKVVTRRGTTVTTTYDSRNRDTLTVIPGVGSRRTAYGGPLDQVTRIWDQSPVDSIGGTSTEVRYGYDARGRLAADTSYTGTVVRATTHVYDRYERDSVMTDALGSWKTLYETLRGYPVALVTPYGDSVVYSYDAQSRAMGPDIWNGGTHRVKGAQHWLPNGTIDTLATTSYASGTGFNSGSWLRPAAESGGDAGAVALAPYWSQQPGVGTTTQILTDSLLYDAWQRLTRWKLIKDGVKLDSVEYTFDRAGNINQTAPAAYDAVTDRLLTRGSGATSDSMTYDRDGNLTRWRTSAGAAWTYGYDGLNQLVSVRRNGTLIVRYAYDVLGRRIAKRVYSTASGGTLGLTRFSYHGGQVGFETDSAGTTIGLRYTWGQGTDELLAVRDAAGNHFYATRDRLGSVRALTTAAGAWRLSEAFTPYGTSLVRDTAGTGIGITLRYRWTGREYDAETGFYYLRARHYSPDIRRFTQEDPIGTAGGSNLYAYAGGSPLEASDPNGLAPSSEGAFNRFLARPYGSNPVCLVGYCPTDTRDPTAWNWGVGILDEWTPRDYIVPAPHISEADIAADIQSATADCCGADPRDKPTVARASAVIGAGGSSLTTTIEFSPLTQTQADWVSNELKISSDVQSAAAGIVIALALNRLGDLGTIIGGGVALATSSGLEYNPHPGDRITTTIAQPWGFPTTSVSTVVTRADGSRLHYNHLLWEP